ncbi:MAG: transglycosylase SLT domain-containing protein [Chloracidobacterium sp.]|nr:transglycosylase SLT domain-containing protein [Chloracidobacterium sp.]
MSVGFAARLILCWPIYDPIASLEAWGEYMNYLLTMFGWRYDLALAAYNSGENRAEYQAAYSQNRAINWSALPVGVQSQTPHYVDSILGSAGYTESDAVAMNIGGGGGENIAAAGNGGGAPSSSLPAWLIVGAIGLAAVIGSLCISSLCIIILNVRNI